VFAIAVGDALRDPAERAAIEPALGRLGFRQVSWIGEGEIDLHIQLVSIVDLRADEACGGLVGLADWSARLAEAEDQVQLLAPAPALALLAGLRLDLACLDAVPRQQDLVRLGVVFATAHAVAAAEAPNPALRFFHESEQARALALAAAFGPDLPPPSWLAPSLRQGLLDAQSAAQAGDGAPVVIGGKARGLWLDGQHVAAGFRRLGSGTHLLQATWGDDVVAARLLDIQPGKRLLVEVDPGGAARDQDDLPEELARLGPGVEPDPMLADLLGLLAEEADDALIVALGPTGPWVWGRGRGGLVRRDEAGAAAPGVRFEDLGEAPAPRVAPDRPDPLPFTVGLGPALLLCDLGGGDLEGLGGLAGGFTLDGRVSFARRFAAAVAVHPVARAATLPPGFDARWLWRAMIPLRVGLRYGAPTPRLGLELGPDLALLFLGAFDGAQVVEPLGALSVGLHLPLAPAFGLRFDLWAGLGNGVRAGGVQFVALAHPAPPPEGRAPGD